jgi:hypothetical protein
VDQRASSRQEQALSGLGSCPERYLTGCIVTRTFGSGSIRSFGVALRLFRLTLRKWLHHVMARLSQRHGPVCFSVMARLVRATYRGTVLAKVARTSQAMTNGQDMTLSKRPEPRVSDSAD